MNKNESIKLLYNLIKQKAKKIKKQWYKVYADIIYPPIQFNKVPFPKIKFKTLLLRSIMSHCAPIMHDVDFSSHDIDIDFADALKDECKDGFVMHYEYRKLYNIKIKIFIYIIKKIVIISKYMEAEIFGFTNRISLSYSAGESVDINEEDLLEVQSLKKRKVIACKKYLYKVYKFFMKDYQYIEMFQNSKLPLWLNVEFKHDVIHFTGTPDAKDAGLLLIRMVIFFFKFLI